MKKFNFFIVSMICCLLFIIGCKPDPDPYIETKIEIKNESSNNLHITLKSIPSGSGGFNEQFDVGKEKSVVFYLRAGLTSEGVKHRDPNKEAVYINIFNSDTKKLIKQLQNDNNLFEFIKTYTDHSIFYYYIFKITDELLL
jgi:hypothetical protein